MALLEEVQTDADASLVERCREGDNRAFTDLVVQYQDRVYNVVYRFLGNREDAEDVAQEVFVRAYRNIGEFRGDAKVYTWLYTIAANLARNRLRDRSRKGRNKGVSLDAIAEDSPGAAQHLARTDAAPDQAAHAREMEDMLQTCLTELPEHYRLVFVLRTTEQLSYDEIAECVGCPRGTVKSRLNQARKLLQQRLTELEVI